MWTGIAYNQLTVTSDYDDNGETSDSLTEEVS
jgi:hypothetical protein